MSRQIWKRWKLFRLRRLGFAEGGVKREKRVAVLVVGRERESGKSTEGLHWGLLSWLLAAGCFSACGFLGHMHADLCAWLLCMTMRRISSTGVATRQSVLPDTTNGCL